MPKKGRKNPKHPYPCVKQVRHPYHTSPFGNTYITVRPPFQRRTPLNPSHEEPVRPIPNIWIMDDDVSMCFQKCMDWLAQNNFEMTVESQDILNLLAELPIQKDSSLEMLEMLEEFYKLFQQEIIRGMMVERGFLVPE